MRLLIKDSADVTKGLIDKMTQEFKDDLKKVRSYANEFDLVARVHRGINSYCRQKRMDSINNDQINECVTELLKEENTYKLWNEQISKDKIEALIRAIARINTSIDFTDKVNSKMSALKAIC